ncbi:sensor histidine kinase [Paenibacillus sp.]|uniref:sensor histidine kinase n=1 Tax=Paenibacillus sp. TaxID=58172 RepID=UPI002D4CA067|nr:ATP-binding protein [Paenibacillus sp.]HZG84233.1 ATP-binding protein [Paenibacillus sp.]
MKAQAKLGWLLFGYGMAVFGATAGAAVLAAPGIVPARSGGVKLAAACLIAAFVVGGLSFALAATASRRLASLAEQAEAVRLHPALHAVELPGADDELASLARAINALKSELTRGEETRNQLVADVAHELRTPLAIIRGHLETMLKGAEELKPENLVPLLDETRRMSRLIQDMRDLNLAEAGRLQLDRAWVGIAPTLQEIVSIMEMEAEEKAATIRVEGEWDGEVYCDRTRIKQVLVNLIGNAIRYAPEGGAVTVRYAEEDGTLRIDVADNGPGIPPEHVPYIFKRFYRVEASRSRASGGTGLGLAIAKEFIEAHGGTIQVASRVGEGTEFTVRLPVFPLQP